MPWNVANNTPRTVRPRLQNLYDHDHVCVLLLINDGSLCDYYYVLHIIVFCIFRYTKYIIINFLRG